jgi:hypothetical protein
LAIDLTAALIDQEPELLGLPRVNALGLQPVGSKRGDVAARRKQANDVREIHPLAVNELSDSVAHMESLFTLEVSGDRMRDGAADRFREEQPLPSRVQVHEHGAVAGVDPILA